MLKIIVMLLLAVGTVMWLYSMHLPYYSDEDEKEALDNSVGLNGVKYPNIQGYYTKVAALRTPKASLEDAGSGLVVFSLVLLAAFFVRKVDSFDDLRKIGGFNKMLLIVISLIMWLMLLPGTLWYYGHRAGRGDYPWFADTIFIPIYINWTCMGVFFIGLLVLLPILTVWYTADPNVFIRAKTYNGITIIVDVFYGLMLAFAALVICNRVIKGDHITIIVTMYFFYLFLALRAGWLTRMDNVR